MAPSTFVYWVILDPLTFWFGTLGAYLVFQELSNLERRPNIEEWKRIFKKLWVGFLGLAIAIVYFIFRIATELNR